MKNIFYQNLLLMKINNFKDNQFNSNIMNSIGVDFKLKNIDFEGKLVKMQIVI